MELFLGEHGQTIQYGIIGVIIISLINVIFTTGLKDIMPNYYQSHSMTNKGFVEKNKKKCPVIDCDEVIYVNHLGNDSDFLKEIKATDCNGNDITKSMKIYGTVNANYRGVYPIKCIVRSDNGLKCIKNINVIVE